jgi:phage-related protein
MTVTTYNFPSWNANYNYSKWDVIYGSSVSDTRYFYATIASYGADPLGQYVFSPLTLSRTDNVNRVTFNQTGTIFFQPGSVVVVSGIQPDPSCNYTGVVLTAGSGYVDYLNPGLNVSNVVTAGGVRAPIHPYWTTGFYWIPSWTTDVTHETAVIKTQLGEGYSQRQTTTINSNSLAWNLVFAERSDKEIASMLNFLQNYGGATPFKLAFPVGNLYNRADLQYVSGPPRHGLTAYGLNAVTVPVNQVFDIG